jgi:hypothetical protein
MLFRRVEKMSSGMFAYAGSRWALNFAPAFSKSIRADFHYMNPCPESPSSAFSAEAACDRCDVSRIKAVLLILGPLS